MLLGPLADRMVSLQEPPELALSACTEKREGMAVHGPGVRGSRTRAAELPAQGRTRPPHWPRNRGEATPDARDALRAQRRGSLCPAQARAHSEHSAAAIGHIRWGRDAKPVSRGDAQCERHVETGPGVGSDRQSRLLQRRGGLSPALGLHSTGLLGVPSCVVWKPEGGVPESWPSRPGPCRTPGLARSADAPSPPACGKVTLTRRTSRGR